MIVSCNEFGITLMYSLNGASIDNPEWNFSKMMRSAKIRFADFSIIRLIQILGNYGNWRQVLQVIEWMQARERFKSNRIRFDFAVLTCKHISFHHVL